MDRFYGTASTASLVQTPQAPIYTTPSYDPNNALLGYNNNDELAAVVPAESYTNYGPVHSLYDAATYSPAAALYTSPIPSPPLFD